MKKLVAALIVIFMTSSCLKDAIDLLDKTINQTFTLKLPTIKDNIEIPNKINCYIFKDSVLYKVLHNLTIESDSRIVIDVPSTAQLYFLANTEEPLSLASLKEGEKNLSSFLLICNENIEHNQWGGAIFYSGSVMIDPALNTDNRIELLASVAQIDIDAGSNELIQIDSIEMSGASLTTPLFQGVGPVSATNKQN